MSMRRGLPRFFTVIGAPATGVIGLAFAVAGYSSFWLILGDVRVNGPGWGELHGHLPGLSQGGACTRAFDIDPR